MAAGLTTGSRLVGGVLGGVQDLAAWRGGKTGMGPGGTGRVLGRGMGVGMGLDGGDKAAGGTGRVLRERVDGAGRGSWRDRTAGGTARNRLVGWA